MAATVVRTDQGTWRAECRNETCRSTVGQRRYWRTGHLYYEAAAREANEHNHDVHAGAVVEFAPTLAAQGGTR